MYLQISAPGKPFDEHAARLEGSVPSPSAPPLQMEPVAGYEGVGFTAGGKFLNILFY